MENRMEEKPLYIEHERRLTQREVDAITAELNGLLKTPGYGELIITVKNGRVWKRETRRSVLFENEKTPAE
jgi:hypothetical protein